jgi:YrbI family 3-deoxy-D-manno-octulosonate 8-phosphate phosphatase
MFVLSTETNEIVGRRCEKLGLPFRQGLDDKVRALQELAKTLEISLQATVYVGNDINDFACLKQVGLPVVVADAHPDVLAAARYRTQAAGGYGAVREVCDWIVGPWRPEQ